MASRFAGQAVVLRFLAQAPRTLGTLGACVFPCMFILLPSLVLMEMTADDQKYNMTDIFKLPSPVASLGEKYFCVVMLPLLLYMPGDGVVLTVASYDKLSHNPVLISVVCLTAKWLVAYMLFYLLFYAEGLAFDPQCKSYLLTAYMHAYVHACIRTCMQTYVNAPNKPQKLSGQL